MHNRKFIATVIAILVAAAGSFGCKDDTAQSSGDAVTAKQAPADPGFTPQPASPPPPTTEPAEVAAKAELAEEVAAGERQSEGGVSWEIPPGWSRGGPRDMRIATLTDGDIEIAITSFPGDVGGILANVNRWRQQVGLASVQTEAEAEKQITDINVAGRTIRLVDITGDLRMLVAIVPGDERLYFFRMVGHPEEIAAREDVFKRLVRTIRVQ